MEEKAQTISFRGGPAASVVPLAVFLLFTVVLVISGTPAVEGMIIASMAGISAGMALARDMAAYSERVFSLMANRVATVAVVCWLWAGAFSGILGDSGLVEAMVWIGWKINLTGALFTTAVFIFAALFATSVGTGLGTIVGFTAILYPAGIVLGGHPGAIMGAIFSGAALGDNLAPISDTTIVSAATQETDVGGVVRSRFKYVAIAAGLSIFCFLLLGSGETQLPAATAEKMMADTADPKGLPMLIPALVVFLVAVSGRHFLAALTAGIVTAMIVAPLAGVFPLDRIFHLTDAGAVGGTAVSGAMALLPTAVLTLLLVTVIGIMDAGGFLEQLLDWLDRVVARDMRGAELAIIVLITFTNICVSVNTVAMITAGPLANSLRRRHGIHPYRSANLLDTISCSFPYILPYSATIVAAAAVQQEISARYAFAPVLSWSETSAFYFYGLILFPLMLIAVFTGFGRRKGTEIPQKA